MFKFLKEKLGNVINKFSKKIEESEIKNIEPPESEIKIKEPEKHGKEEEKSKTKNQTKLDNKIIEKNKENNHENNKEKNDQITLAEKIIQKVEKIEENKEVKGFSESEKKKQIHKEKKVDSSGSDSVKEKNIEEKITEKEDSLREKDSRSLNYLQEKKEGLLKIATKTISESENEKEVTEESKDTKNVQEEKIETEIKDKNKKDHDEQDGGKKEVEKKGFFSKIFSKKEKKVTEEKSSVKDHKHENIIENIDDKGIEEKKGFFNKVSDTFTKIQLSEEKFDELFWDLEITLLENNVAVEIIDIIKKDLKEQLTTGKISRKNVDEIITDTLRESLDKVLSIKGIDLEEEISKKKPYVIAVIGVNGSGKTTTIAKLVHYLKKKELSVVLAAADTFRAAAIQQLEEHAQRLDVKLIKHDYNSDPAAVAFDAIKHAEAKGIDVVIIDTAGRMHSNDNLMNELRKLIKVNKPDLKIFVGESITGNDCVEQAKAYNELIGIDAIILSKADVDEKGGAAISISHVTKKPIIFIGTGQTYDDIEAFDKKKIIASVGL